jgi:hypothetical protein
VPATRCEFAHCDSADVRQVLSRPLDLELHLSARQRVGEDLTEEIQLLNQLPEEARIAPMVLNTSPPTTVAPTSRGTASGFTRYADSSVDPRRLRGEARRASATWSPRCSRAVSHELIPRPSTLRSPRSAPSGSPENSIRLPRRRPELDHAVQAVPDLAVEVDGQVAERRGQIGGASEAQALARRGPCASARAAPARRAQA